MKEEVMNSKGILFINKKGEKLSLEEIIDSRVVKSVTLNYLSKKRLEKINTFSRRMIGFKTEVQDKLSVEIASHNLDLILLLDQNIETVVVKISSLSEFNKIIDGSYDENSIKKQVVHCLVAPYRIIVPLEALIKVDFEE